MSAILADWIAGLDNDFNDETATYLRVRKLSDELLVVEVDPDYGATKSYRVTIQEIGVGL